MYYETVVVPDAEMPDEAPDWFSVKVAEDQYATVYSESFAARQGRRVMCHDGVPIKARPPRRGLRLVS